MDVTPSLLLHLSTGPCMFAFVHRNNVLRENTVQEMNFVDGFEGAKPVATLLHWGGDIHSL